MTLVEYITKLYKNGPELWDDVKTVHDPNTKATIKRDVARLRKCSLAIVSCDTAEEWYRICRRECPVGTIIDEFDKDADQWNELFNDVTVLVRAELTSSLLLERNYKSAKTLLDVLERRDKSHWGKDSKTIAAESTDVETGKTLKITLNSI